MTQQRYFPEFRTLVTVWEETRPWDFLLHALLVWIGDTADEHMISGEDYLVYRYDKNST
jgi:hypothetical protein